MAVAVGGVGCWDNTNDDDDDDDTHTQGKRGNRRKQIEIGITAAC